MAPHRLPTNNVESVDFPMLCGSCLGDNPYIRMTKADHGKECKICTRPFTVFWWRPGSNARFKKTEICKTCSNLKNVCQVCLLDLEYGLPVQVRDTALSINSNDAIPMSNVNREYYAEERDRKARAGIDYESSYRNTSPNDTILKLQRTAPYYKRNRAHVCTFNARGQCTRGSECAYRHEMPETGELSHQHINDRFHGVNDPVAMKLQKKAGEMRSLEPPEDESIRTLYIGGVNAGVTEQDLRDKFNVYGEIESVKMVFQQACAFVTYKTREGAERAAEELVNKLVIKGLRLKLQWGRPQVRRQESEQYSVAPQGPRMPYFNNNNIHALPLGQERAHYPSMDPQRMGAAGYSDSR